MIGSNRFQKGSLIRVKNKNTADTWFLRYYEDVQGKRVYRKRKIGTVREYPHRRDAERAVLSLRANINSGVHSPETVNELVAHYLKYELTPERKAFSTVEVNSSFLKLYIVRNGESLSSRVSGRLLLSSGFIPCPTHQLRGARSRRCSLGCSLTRSVTNGFNTIPFWRYGRQRSASGRRPSWTLRSSLSCSIS